MKVWIFVILYIFTSIFYVSAKDLKIDHIEAIVNDEIILNSDVNEILFFLKKEGKDLHVPLKSDFLKDQVVKKLIVDSLILQEAKKMNITVTKQQIDSVIKNIAFKKNMTINELKNYFLFKNFNNYFSYENYRKYIEKLLKIKVMQDYELRKRINISEQKVNFLFEKIIRKNKKSKRINLSYILLPFLKNNNNYSIENDKKILAENIIKKLKKSQDFEKLYTECKKNHSLFGVKKMFWMRFSDIQNKFSSTLNIIKKGQILGPILGDKGFYILKVNDIDHNKENIITEYYIQHCLIKPSLILTDKESKKNIFNIYKNIKKGIYSFDYAVQNLSNDFSLSSPKGDLGWISTELFDYNFNKLISNLKKNEISKPIKSIFGWHIIKLLNKREVDKFYSFKKKQANNILLDQKIRLEKNKWIEELKNLSYIKIM